MEYEFNLTFYFLQAVSTAPSYFDDVNDFDALLKKFEAFINCFENTESIKLAKVWEQYKPTLLARLDDLKGCRNLTGEAKEK